MERRKYPRIDIDLVTVEVYETAEPTSAINSSEICNVMNISEDGMCFISDHAFDNKLLLRLTFLLPESIVIIRTDASVAYVTKNSAKKYSIGVQFRGLDPSERKQIRHFVNKVITTQTPQT
ncbi:MAG: PilZ domain-containing protein [Chitinispirillaceae bacterium]|nr:PilZ domain-containing protein [Chitinispirillaceae bacterium]